jgi:hypothetical protein
MYKLKGGMQVLETTGDPVADANAVQAATLSESLKAITNAQNAGGVKRFRSRRGGNYIRVFYATKKQKGRRSRRYKPRSLKRPKYKRV